MKKKKNKKKKKKKKKKCDFNFEKILWKNSEYWKKCESWKKIYINLNWCIVNFFPWLSWNGGTFWCLKSSQNWSNWCKSLAMEVDLLCSSVPFRVKWMLEWLIQWPLKLVENIKESRLCKYAYFNHHSSNWKITKLFLCARNKRALEISVRSK